MKRIDNIGADQEEGVLSLSDQIERAWALSGANQPASEEEAAAARDALTEYHFMQTAELEVIIGLDDKNTPEYRAALAVLMQRGKEYRPGQSGGLFYRGNGPRIGGGNGR